MNIRKGLLKCLVATVVVTMIAPIQFTNSNALSGWIKDSDLTSKGTMSPSQYGPIPDALQYQYQKEELAAFCHFGPNTFNGIEWGENYGNRLPSDIFKLSADDEFDAETLVSTLKNAGFKRLIVTAKHHDGFCIWSGEHTDYDVGSTNYKDGHGDILEEISTACTKYDMNMGLYLSPWDIRDKSYGYFDKDGAALVGSNGQPSNGMTWDQVEEKDIYDYNEYYDNQLEEILGNPKYGNNGEFVEIWMDGAKGSGYKTQNYNFQKWFTTIQRNEGIVAGREADCLLFGSGARTTVRWIGNEHGFAPDTNWAQCKLIKNSDGVATDVDTGWNEQTGYSAGFPDGDVWTVPESDARITSGWFWGTAKKTPKTMEELSEMYFRSVGHNSTLLLNVPPNDKGKMDSAIVDRITEFGNAIKDTFKTNKAKDMEVVANSVLDNDKDYSPINVIDNNQNTYWTPNQTNKGSLIVDLKQNTKFDVVSIEEAIQKGQRIHKYKVEYSQDATSWQTLEEGTTVGAKRLVRSGTINARYVKITVETNADTVPLVSEVGIYKATSGLERSVNVPDGMVVVDNIDNNITDGFGFTNVSSGWTQETGMQYLNQTNMWAGANQTFDIKFHGTKFYLMGTEDSNHGKATISIDGGASVEINGQASKRKTGVKLFTSDDLTDGDHTLRLTTQGVFGIEGALVIDNGGKGMLEFENSDYRVNEAENESNTLEHKIKVIRVGGSNGEVSATVENNPGTAMQGNYDASNSGGTITLVDGVKEKEVSLYTKYDSRVQGDTSFTMNLVDGKNVIIGFKKVATITISDRDLKTKVELQTLITECEGIKTDEQLYKSDMTNFMAVLKDAKILVSKDSATDIQFGNAYHLLDNAKKALVKRDSYTIDDRFIFPLRTSDVKIAEIEFGVISNVSNTTPDRWPIQVENSNWASNGKVINCINPNDTIKIPYYAAKTGTYSVELTYGGSGSTSNGVSISEENGNITNTGFIAAGSNNASNTGLITRFDIQVVKEGNGTLIITGGPNKASGLDKITLKPKSLNYTQYTITTSIEGHGTVQTTTGTGNQFNEFSDITYSIVPSNGYKIKDVLVKGQSVGVVSSYTFNDLQSDADIKVIFEFTYYNENESFALPTEIGNEHTKVLEAEMTELTNTGAANEEWKLGIEDRDWASGGKIINCFNNSDKLTIHYNAEKVGLYVFVTTYRSGSVANGLTWSGDNVDSGNVVAGGSSANETKTVEFTINVKKTGTSKIVFTAPTTNSPILDKFSISYYGDEISRAKYDLNTAINAAKEEVKKEDVYNPTSIENLKIAIQTAQNVHDNSTNVNEVTNAKTTLQGVMNNLEDKVKKGELETALSQAKVIVDDINKYSPNSILGFEDNYKEGTRIYNDENATQDAVDAIVIKLQINIDNAKKKADVDDLQKQVVEAKNINLDGYTEASTKIFHDVLSDAEELLTNELTFKNQVEVDLLSSRLLKVRNLLTKESDLQKDEYIKSENPLEDLVVTNPDQSITISGKLPIGVKLTSDILNKNDMEQLNTLIKKMNPDFFKNKTLEKVYDLNLLLNDKEYIIQDSVEVVLKLDKNLKGKKLGVIYIDDQGNIKAIDSIVDGDYIKFEAIHFSRYAIVTYQEGNVGPGQKPSEPGEIVKPGAFDKVETGDKNQDIYGLACLSLCSIVGIGIILKRKKENDKC